MSDRQVLDAATDALAEELGTELSRHDVRSVSGGDINRAVVMQTSEGPYFVKWNDGQIPDLFVREAEGLRAMRESETSLVIPEPLVARAPNDGLPGFLVMDYVESGTRASDFDETLGRGLAELHEASAEKFGFEHDNYCGETIQPNEWTDDWVEFYREHRLRHQLRLAVDHRHVDDADRQRYETLLDRIDAYLGIDPEPPALIHGDLWSGNVLATGDGEPCILDPAAYYGHREAEIGMMQLFGGFSERVYAAYQEVRPLQDGWRDRVELYSLYHLMNHYVLFGGGWGRRAFSIVRDWTG